jgi:ribonuclease I
MLLAYVKGKWQDLCCSMNAASGFLTQSDERKIVSWQVHPLWPEEQNEAGVLPQPFPFLKNSLQH